MWFDYLSMLLLTPIKYYLNCPVLGFPTPGPFFIASSLKHLFNCKILTIFAKFSLTSPLSVHLRYTCRLLPPSPLPH